MHSHRRISVILALLLVAVPLGTVSFIGSLTEKYATVDELNEALDDAAASYRSGQGLFALQKKREAERDAAAVALKIADDAKYAARMAVVAVDRELRDAKTRYGIDVSQSGALLAFIGKEQERLSAFARYLHTRNTITLAMSPDLGVRLITRMLHMSLGEMTEVAVRDRVLERARLRVFQVAMRAQEAQEERKDLHAAYAEALTAYGEAWEDYRRASESAEEAAERIDDVRRITEEVHAQVLELQGELARIDARLKAKIERDLIEKGLMDAQPGERSDGKIRSEQTFRWPVIGRVSAGFMNAAYEKFFGVPHRGMDIVVGQGSRGRATQGVIVMRLNARDKVATMSVIMHDPESEQAVLEAAEEMREGEVQALEEEQAKVERTAKRQRKAAAK